MAIKTWAEMFDDVMPDLPQCPSALVTHHLRKAAIAFCEESGAYRFWAEALDVEINSNEIDLDTPPQTEVVGIVSVKFNGSDVIATSQADLSAQDGDWFTTTGDTPTHYYQMEPGTLLLYPLPSAADPGSLSVSVKVKPKENASGLESWVYKKYHEGICAKALYELKSMESKPWTANSARKLDGLMASYTRAVFKASHEGVTSMTRTARRAVGSFM